MNRRELEMNKEVSPYDIWKAKANLVDFYKQDYERLQVVNKLLMAGLVFSLTTTFIVTWYLCKYL